jgi:ADP-ribose pyrophosphatase YjhB (NUDIX family)
MSVQLKWLDWARQLQAISQTGLTYCKDVYDIERYEQLSKLSMEILTSYTDMHTDKVRDLFAKEKGYATPKVDVRGVVFKDEKILLVKEKEDGLWSLPGGWADIGLSPGEVAVKEVKEESGFDVKPVKILAVLDKNKHNHPPSFSHIYKIFILCEIIGGEAGNGLETIDVQFYGKHNLPSLSLERNTIAQIETMFEFLNNQRSATLFD